MNQEMGQQRFCEKPALLTPECYNILLTRHGEEISFDFPPATATHIQRFGYVEPNDSRCKEGIISSEESLLTMLRPIIGEAKVALQFQTCRQVIISLHDTAILGYQRQLVIDPRLPAKVAILWEIYVDLRTFPQAEEPAWQLLLGQLIAEEKAKELAESIKDRLLEQAKRD